MSSLRGYDSWLTRTPWDDMPDYPPPPPKCTVCGRFMKDEPLHIVTGEDVMWCDGKPYESTDVYTRRDAGILDIIGWEFLGQPTNATYPAPCGEDKVHEGHFEVINAYTVVYRRCSAGHLSKEFIV